MSLDESTYREAGALIDRATEVWIVSHHRPDGDAIGSTVAAAAVLRGRGKRVRSILLDPAGQRYQGLLEGRSVEVWDAASHADALASAEAALVLDTSSWSQLEAARGALEQADKRLIVVDHHQTQDDLGAVRLLDPTAAATGLILFEWFSALKWKMSGEALEGLFAALATDTGWFRFSNADARAMGIAAELVRAGVAAHRVYEQIYWSESPARIRLAARALATMELHAEGRLAVMRVDEACFRDCQAQRGDTEDLINEPMRIATVALSVLMVEQADGRVRVSLRSKGEVDVAALASRHGGGGHSRAAGFQVSGPIASAYEKILDGLRAAARGAGAGA